MKLNIQLFASDGAVIIDAKLDTKSFDVQIAQLEKELEEYDKQYESYANAGRKLTEQEAEDFDKLKKKIEQTENKLIGYKKQQLQLSEEPEKMNLGFDKAIKKVVLITEIIKVKIPRLHQINEINCLNKNNNINDINDNHTDDKIIPRLSIKLTLIEPTKEEKENLGYQKPLNILELNKISKYRNDLNKEDYE